MSQYSNNRNRKEKRQATKKNQVNQRIKDLNSIKTLAERNPIAARTEIVHYVEENPTDMFGYFFYGYLEELLNNFDAAIQLYEKVASSESNNKYSAIVRLGEIARKRGQEALAKKYYRRAIAESPNEERYAIYTLARLERIEKNYDEALRLLKMIKNPDEQTKIEIAKTLSTQGKYAEATAILDIIHPKNESQRRTVLVEKGKIAHHQGNIPQAKAFLEDSLASALKDETYFVSLQELVTIEMDEEEYQTAISYCNELLLAGQDFNKDIHLLLGVCQQKIGVYDQALQNYKIAATSSDYETYSDAYYYLGCLQFMKGDFEEARQSLLKSIEGDKKKLTPTITKLISISLKQGKYSEVDKYLKILKEVAPKAYASTGLNPVRILLAKANGQPLRERNNYESYSERQAVRYIPKEAIKHIRENHATGKGTKSNFSGQIDIEELFDDIKIQMVPENKVNTDAMDLYEIDCKDVGYDQQGNIAHRIRVIALPNTLNILTMYPIVKSDTPRQFDIEKQIASGSGKVNSRIDRFNKRFANFKKPQ